MNIIKAQKIGFCFGVRRSIQMAQEALNEESRPVFLLGSIVHNEEVIRDIEGRGGIIVSDPEESDRQSVLITKAHGVPHQTLEKAQDRKLQVKDTTCPIVKTAQQKARELSQQGYQVVIIGEKTHPEPQVIQEYAGEDSIITEDKEEIANLNLTSPVGVVAQTTKKREKLQELIQAIQKKGVEVKGEDTICNEVSDRQQELKQILHKTQGVVVIGSRTSANTTRLAEIVKDAGQKLWWVNSVEELSAEEIQQYDTIGVVSGTSAPDWEVERIMNYLNNL